MNESCTVVIPSKRLESEANTTNIIWQMVSK